MEAKRGGLACSQKQICRHSDVPPSQLKREGTEVKYQVKRSIHEVNGSWTDYKSRADHCQEVAGDNIPLNSDIFNNFNKPYVVPALPVRDGKEDECASMPVHREYTWLLTIWKPVHSL